MSQIFKIYLILFIFVIGTLTLFGICGADQAAAVARSTHANIINEIECSNFSDSAINEIKTKTDSDSNYNLTINRISDSTGKTVTAEVILQYKYSIPILNVLSEHSLYGYAR